MHTEGEARDAVKGANVAIVNFATVPVKVLEEITPDTFIIRRGTGYDNVSDESPVNLTSPNSNCLA